MANPNIVSVTSILGGTLVRTPSSTAAVSLLNNAASSGTIVKIESLVAANTSASAVNCTVSYYSNATTEGSAPSGGTAYPICSTVSVPANASLVVIEKSNGIYLLENACISVTSGTANNLTFTISYEVIS
jgi:hypothetical protein